MVKFFLADYVLALKENQLVLLEEVEDEFRFSPTNDSSIDVDYIHGRIQTRKYSVIEFIILNKIVSLQTGYLG